MLIKITRELYADVSRNGGVVTKYSCNGKVYEPDEEVRIYGDKYEDVGGVWVLSVFGVHIPFAKRQVYGPRLGWAARYGGTVVVFERSPVYLVSNGRLWVLHEGELIFREKECPLLDEKKYARFRLCDANLEKYVVN